MNFQIKTERHNDRKTVRQKEKKYEKTTKRTQMASRRIPMN